MPNLELFRTDWREIWGADSPNSLGAVYTKRGVVDSILDLAGYVVGPERLALRPLLEPSCGSGAFIRAIVERLIHSEQAHRTTVTWDSEEMRQAIRACDISPGAVGLARATAIDTLVQSGCAPRLAADLAKDWFLHTDFLLHEWDRSFAFVIGNPPYVRLEALPRRVLAFYRARYRTATDRADLYIPFFERALGLLAADGCLALICANRFAKNKYGGALRALIAEQYHVRYYVNLEHTQPFLQDVSAYPAIVVIDRDRGTPTLAATVGPTDGIPITAQSPDAAARIIGGIQLEEFAQWYPDGAPWVTTHNRERLMLGALAEGCPELEESAAGTRVGIGVATGADDVFVLSQLMPDIEEDRQLPLLMASDISTSALRWGGRYVLNPFSDAEPSGSLVALDDYPGLEAYLLRNAARLMDRHIARSRPGSWYRTVDRVWRGLTCTPKLVMPDIQRGGVVGLDDGQYYPHHNVYWITSHQWPLAALQAILRSSIALAQVRAFSVQLRGGSIRYQSQTLRRLRVPPLATLSPELLEELEAMGSHHSQSELDEVVRRAYDLDVVLTGSY